MTMERWLPTLRHSGYEVSDLGRVRSIDRTGVTAHGVSRRYRGHLLKPGPTGKQGHLTVMLGRDCGTVSVHVLVLEAFVGPRPEGREALHRDNDPSNNKLDNLRWGTRSENSLDRVVAGNYSLKMEEVEYIRRVYTKGDPALGNRGLAKKFGVVPSTIGNVISGKHYNA